MGQYWIASALQIPRGGDGTIVWYDAAVLDAKWDSIKDDADRGDRLRTGATLESLASTCADRTAAATMQQPRSLRDISQQTYVPLKEFVAGLLAIGLTLLIGKSKLGKSYLLLDLTLARAGPTCTRHLAD